MPFLAAGLATAPAPQRLRRRLGQPIRRDGVEELVEFCPKRRFNSVTSVRKQRCQPAAARTPPPGQQPGQRAPDTTDVHPWPAQQDHPTPMIATTNNQLPIQVLGTVFLAFM
jgi:hypothetical protein